LSKSISAALATFAAAFAIALGSAAFAQPAPSPSPAAAPSGAPKATASAAPSAAATASPSPAPTKLIVITGSGDAGYTHVFNSTTARFVNGNPARIFDASTGPFFDANGGRQLSTPTNFVNSLDLQNANLQFTLNGPIGAKIETSFGTDADVIASNGQSRSGFNVTQAYLQGAYGPVTIIAGKFSTFAGAEVIEAPGNSNYSRSFLFGLAIPFTHTGVRLSYAPISKVTINAGLNNGWDDWKFAGKKKTIEGNVTLNPSPGYSLSLTTYNGNDFAVSGNSAAAFAPVYTNRMLYDGVLTLHPTSALTLIANYDNGTQLADSGAAFPTAAHWNGIAGYANYQISSLYGVSLRKETFHDINGFRTGVVGFSNVVLPGLVPTLSLNGPRLQSNTATFNYTPNGNYIFRAEYRADAADQPIFTYNGVLPTNGFGATVGRQSQSTFGLEAVVKFP
jgi:hypothetical protein